MEMQQTNYLFVYGSLRRGLRSPAYEYIGPFFDYIGIAKVKGILYDMGDYPVALPAPDSNNYLVGELYRLKNDEQYDWAFAQLDDYEGVLTEPGETAAYYRKIVPVYYNDEVIAAYIYWYNGQVTGKPVVSSGDVLVYIQEKNSSRR